MQVFHVLESISYMRSVNMRTCSLKKGSDGPFRVAIMGKLKIYEKTTFKQEFF